MSEVPLHTVGPMVLRDHPRGCTDTNYTKSGSRFPGTGVLEDPQRAASLQASKKRVSPFVERKLPQNAILRPQTIFAPGNLSLGLTPSSACKEFIPQGEKPAFITDRNQSGRHVFPSVKALQD